MGIKNISFDSLLDSFNELKNRLLFLFFSIFIFRIGTFISIPGINIHLLNNIFKNNNSIINIFNIFSGGTLFNTSIFALGIIPYISSSVIIQLLTFTFPSFLKLNNNNIDSRLKINRYMKYLTLFLSIIQSILVFLTINKFNNYGNIFLYNNLINYIISIISLITGTIFLMWLGEQISENGLGNGISVIMFIGIISNLPKSLFNLFNLIINKNLSYIKLLLMFFLIIFTIYFIIFVELAERKILVIYPSKGYRNIKYFFSSYNTFLPFKVNMSGIIPSIFTSSIMLIPSVILIWLNNFIKSKYIFYIYNLFFPKNFLYLLIYIFFIIFFCFFYSLLIYNPKNIANNLKMTGAYIPKIRPGKNTSFFLKKKILKLTLFSSIYILIICLIPDFIYNILNINFSFNGTSLLIIITVIIDFISQIKSLIMSNSYFSIFKKI